MTENNIKDANDVLRAWQGEGVPQEEQEARLRQALSASRTLAEACCGWAGALEGPERDEGLKVAFDLVRRMEGVTRAQYRVPLAKALGVTIREFNDIVRAAEKSKKDEKGQEHLESLGGEIGGWLLEYLYDPASDSARFGYRDPQRRIGTAESVEIDGVRYGPKAPNDFIRNGGVLFPSEVGTLKPTRELVAMVEAFIHEHYILERAYLGRIIAYYVLLTWMYDAFNALPYLRAMGEAGAGKSELMRRIGHLCYRMMTASGANTSSSFFRATEIYRGTVFIDEADLHDGGDMSNDLIKYLNLGAMRGNPIWRLEEQIGPEGQKIFEPKTFQTFGPKLIAMRKDFRDDAVMSRSLTLKLMPREPVELKKAGVKLYIDEEFRNRSLAIRNLLVRWRLEHWEREIPVSEDLMDLEISSRLNQVTMPIKAMAQDDAEMLLEIEKFLRLYNMEMVLSRSMTLAARVVEAMWKIYKYEDLRKLFLKAAQDGENEYIMIGDVRKVANEIIDEMNADPEEEALTPGPSPDDGRGEEEGKGRYRKRHGDKLTARGVGALIRNELQLEVGRRRGSGFPVYWDEGKMEALGKRYGIEYEGIGVPDKGAGTGQGNGDTAGRQLELDSG